MTPHVVAFTGHMMDKPGRPSPRFLPGQEKMVALSIRKTLARLNAQVGYSSASCGSDIIFLEEMLARGAAIHIVLPYAVDQFKRDCLTGFLENPGREWLPRFERIWQRADSRILLGDRRAKNNTMASEYCNRTVLGLALLQSEAYAVPPVLIALWDGWSGDAPGGTRSLVKLAESLKVKVEHLTALRPKTVGQVLDSASPPSGTGSSPLVATLSDEPPQQICAVMFADVMQFGDLDENKIPDFVSGYLQPLASLIQQARHKGYGPIDFNTWGDGLFCVFDSLLKAGRFAQVMQQLTISETWKVTGSDEKLKLRIALHAGPVYRIPDPLFPKDAFIGKNITFAARMEPVTPPGRIYCSQAFAALAAAEGIRDFEFKVVGETVLPKGAGTHPLYVMTQSPSLGGLNSRR